MTCAQQTIEATFQGRHYEIPVYWMMGRMLVEERAGVEDPRARYLNAILAWVRQEELERIAMRERRP